MRQGHFPVQFCVLLIDGRERHDVGKQKAEPYFSHFSAL
jgi:hypothetical protein